MKPNIKHKLTFDSPDIFNFQMNRMNRKTKTMLRSFLKVNKDESSQDFSQSICQNEKNIKTLVDGKIQQLHLKMKNFFSQQRITHFDQIVPQFQEMKEAIMRLKQQLSLPKSIEQIEEQKHSLLRRKATLLKQLEKVNKKTRENKNKFYDLKFQSQQLDQQLKNGYATIQKYKRKLNSQLSFLDRHKDGHQQNSASESETANLTKILSENLCSQSLSHSISIHHSNLQGTQHIFGKQKDHVHITEVLETHYHKQAAQNPKKSDNQVLNTLPVNQSDQGGFEQKKHNSYGINNQIEETNKKPTMISNTSFEDYLTCNTVQRSVVGLKQKSRLFKENQHSMDFRSEIRRYKQLPNKGKWKKVNQLFAELQTRCPNIVLPKKKPSQASYQQKILAQIGQLQQILMEELRKTQFQSFKQKGYHEGLNDKAQEIKIETKMLLKNFPGDEFFASVMNKKPVQKKLTLILQNCLQ